MNESAIHTLNDLRVALELEKHRHENLNPEKIVDARFSFRQVLEWYTSLIAEEQVPPDGAEFLYGAKARILSKIQACLNDNDIPVNKIADQIKLAFSFPIIDEKTFDRLRVKYNFRSEKEPLNLFILCKDLEIMRLYFLLYDPSIPTSKYMTRWIQEFQKNLRIDESDDRLQLMKKIMFLLYSQKTRMSQHSFGTLLFPI